jgi:hypothetical protein
MDKTEDNDKINTNIEYHFNIITEIIDKKKTALAKNLYNKAIVSGKYYDEELLTHLEATNHILQNLEERLRQLENYMKR